MIAYYLDSSAFAKRFLIERGSDWVNRQLTATTDTLLASSGIVAVEVVSALARAHRDKKISLFRRNSAIEQVHDEVASLLQTVQVTPPLVKVACRLTTTHGLRAYDAVHLATATQVRQRFEREGLPAPIFVSADRVLLAAAQAEGFQTENPNDHP